MMPTSWAAPAAAAAGGTSHLVAWLPVGTAVIGLLGALALWFLTQAGNRRERRIRTFAEAMAVVSEYAEAPYHVRRRADSSPATRSAVTGLISDVQAKVVYYQAWLAVECPALSGLFDEYVALMRRESGGHMTAAWGVDPMKKDSDVPLGNAYPTPLSDAKRTDLLAAAALELNALFPGHPQPVRRFLWRVLSAVRHPLSLGSAAGRASTRAVLEGGE